MAPTPFAQAAKAGGPGSAATSTGALDVGGAAVAEGSIPSPSNAWLDGLLDAVDQTVAEVADFVTDTTDAISLQMRLAAASFRAIQDRVF